MPVDTKVVGRPRVRRLPLLAGACFALYPAVVWGGLSAGSPRQVAWMLLCILLPAAFVLLRGTRSGSVRFVLLMPPVFTVLAIAGSGLLDEAALLFVGPVVISLGMLSLFGGTLRSGSVPMIERFARLHEPDLAVPKQRWCRTWTWIWCGFFVFNAVAAWLLAALAPMSWWCFYTTTLSYVLMGILFGGEWMLRRRRFGHA